MTLEATAIAVPLNTVFGILCGLAIVRRRFPGKGLVNAFVDLPLALSPVVVGLSLFLLYGRTGWFGHWLLDHGYQVLFALPSIVLATVFVSRAVRRARGDPDAARDRRRAGAGGAHARRLGVADVLADHAAVDPLGGRLRRRPDDRALPRRVRRRRGRLREHRGQDRRPRRCASGGATRNGNTRRPTGSRSCWPRSRSPSWFSCRSL